MSAPMSARRAALLLGCAAITARGALAAELHAQVLDGDDRPVAEAVVYAVPEVPVPPAGPLKAIIDQVDRQFVPRISVIQTGTSVSFPNWDDIRHSVYSFSPARVFTLKLYAGTPSAPVVFDKPGVAVLGCYIHDSMAAWVLVVDTPYFARTDATGEARLANLPAGHYTLHAWSSAMRQESPGEPLQVGAQPLPTRLLHVP